MANKGKAAKADEKAPAKGNGRAKAEPQMSAEEFEKLARDLPILVNGEVTLLARPKKFKTGSLGFFVNDKLPIKIGDRHYRFQSNIQLTLIGSKNAEAESEE